MLLQRLSDNGLWSSLRDMERLQQQLHRMISSDVPNATSEFPPVNVWTSEDGVIVTAELAGTESKDIDVSVVNETLSIRGARETEQLNEGETWHRRERGDGQFVRTIQLPFAVQTDNVQAIFKNGILQITLPRAESEKPRKITVSAN